MPMRITLARADGAPLSLNVTPAEHALLSGLREHVGEPLSLIDLTAWTGRSTSGIQRLVYDVQRLLREAAPGDFALVRQADDYRFVLDDPARVRTIPSLALSWHPALSRVQVHRGWLTVTSARARALLDALVARFDQGAITIASLASMGGSSSVQVRGSLETLSGRLLATSHDRVGIVLDNGYCRLADNHLAVGDLVLKEVAKTLTWRGHRSKALGAGACRALRFLLTRGGTASRAELLGVIADGRPIGRLARAAIVELDDALRALTNGAAHVRFGDDVIRLTVRARARAAVPRTPAPAVTPPMVGSFTIDRRAHTITRGDVHVRLNPTTLKLVAALAAAEGRPVSGLALEQRLFAGPVGRRGLYDQVGLARSALRRFDDVELTCIDGRYCLLTVPSPAHRLHLGAETLCGNSQMMWARLGACARVFSPVSITFVIATLSYAPECMPRDVARAIVRSLAPEHRVIDVYRRIVSHLRQFSDVRVRGRRQLGYQVSLGPDASWWYRGMTLDPHRRTVRLDGATLQLPDAQFGLLVLLAAYPFGAPWELLTLRAGTDRAGVTTLARALAEPLGASLVGDRERLRLVFGDAGPEPAGVPPRRG